jgi:hypothetical protein
MRAFKKDAGRWCRFISLDQEHIGIITTGGQDKNPRRCDYRSAEVFAPDGPGDPFYLIDWPDIKGIGPYPTPPGGEWRY